MIMFYLIVTKWLILREQKVNEILCSDWLPKQARWACCLPYLGFPALVLQEKSLLGHVITLHVGREKLGISHGN